MSQRGTLKKKKKSILNLRSYKTLYALYKTHERNCMKDIGTKMMCGFVFYTFKTIMVVIKHTEKKILRTIQDPTKLLCDMRINEFRGL